MKARWLLATVAAAPLAVALLALQSCGGEGGPIGGGGGNGGDTALVAQFKALWTDSQGNADYIGSNACGAAGCHGTLVNRGDPEDIYSEWHDTKHFSKNVGCESCHGPGSAHAASQSADDILTFPKITNPVVCGQCHGPIYSDYLNSKHRQIIDTPVEDAPSNWKTSRCIACHSGLWRTEIEDKGVDPLTLTVEEVTELAEETLNTVPYTAACATCHNPHSNTDNPNKDGEEVQLRHKVFNQDTAPIGPGTTIATFIRYDHACGECHNGRGADGRDPKLQSSTSRPNMHDSNQFNMLMGVGGAEDVAGPIDRFMAHADATGQCSHCHMPDSRHTFTVSYDKGCAPCHTPEDAATRKAALANEITSALYALRTRMENWAMDTYDNTTPGYENVDSRLFRYLWEYSSNITTEATELGISVTNIPSTHQTNLPIELKRARHNYYFIVRDSSICPHNPPYARYLLDWANTQMGILDGLRPAQLKIKLPSFEQMQRVLRADKERASRADINSMHEGGD